MNIEFSKIEKQSNQSWSGIFLFGLIFAAVAYGWSFNYTYGFLEEFGIHVAPWTHPQSQGGLNTGFFYLLAASGRPIGAAVYWMVQEMAPWISINLLWIYRFLGVLFGVIAASLLAKEIRDQLLSRKEFAYLACGLFVLSPAVAVQAVQGHIFIQPIAGVLSYFAMKKLLAFIESPEKLNLFLAVGLVICANWIYQPWAMLGFLISIIHVLRCGIGNRRRVIIFISSAGLLFVGVAASAAFAFLSLYIRGVQFERLSLANSIFEKLLWFFNFPLSYAGSGFALSASVIFSIFVLIGMALVSFYSEEKDLKTRVFVFGLLVLSAPISWAPNLASSDMNVIIRTLPVLTYLAITIYIVAADRILSAITKKPWQIKYKLISARSIFLLLLVIATFSAQRLVVKMSTPLVFEVSYIRLTLEKFNPAIHKSIIVLRPAVFPWKITGEVGTPNGVMDWSSFDMIRVIWDEQHPKISLKNLKFEMKVSDLDIETRDDEFLVDMRPLYAQIGKVLN